MAGSAPFAMADEVVERHSGGEMVADALVARPIGLVVTGLGLAAFVVSLPFSFLGGNVEESADRLISEPVKATFQRCLGCRQTNPDP
ncbi:MAG: hypothetical protein J4A00_03100 [Gammaproteobacteria bacterium]|nr:hypothetical protein [Gammaproteobacteria bacterium]